MAETVKSEVIDFGGVVVQNNKYVGPGQYIMSIESAKFVKPTDRKPDGSAKTPYIETVFSGEHGKVSCNFYLTAKALERLQYVHQEWAGKPCDKKFTSLDEAGLYFEKLLNHEKIKSLKKRMFVYGHVTNGKTYAEVGFTNWVIPDDALDFVEEAYVPGSPKYVLAVKVVAGGAPTSNSVILPSTSSRDNNGQVADSENDLPF